ncbi:MAG: UDP-N-acetylmuramoyl-L-alanyl-D-glutamate--2,6-diaminopimelate ligase [Clostridia bacterium]|nr:UDP-N-acetylmuramoyl-L-alanyl-D-glutamate--2,6-diaminopimelate ligase [Clostridia bacterium]
MLLSKIAEELKVPFIGEDVEISSVEYNSRHVQRGALFGCIVGLVSDGHNFAKQAVDKGAVALICQRPLDIAVPQLIVEDARTALAEAAACFYEHPEREMCMLAVTGTNGKTSTTYMVKAIAESAGMKVGLIGTIVNMIGNERIDTARTTPESVDLFALLRHMANEGCKLVIMEVSSHALVQDRVFGIEFNAGLFTNLTQDHLDYHKTWQNYFEAKKLLFRQSRVAIINADDAVAERMCEGLTVPVYMMGIQKGSDYRASGIDITTKGVTFHLHTPKADARIALKISGLFSVYNAMGAAALCEQAGCSMKDIVSGLESLSGVAGRLQSVNTFNRDFAVYVDYAHTPDALKNVLNTCKGFARARVISVFGCGGDRDRAKRPIMGEIGGSHSDFVVITSDNPRTEEPMRIIEEIEAGVKRTSTPYKVIENRKQAIAFALSIAKPHDIIVIAGKGHENYQEINGVKHHFDDKETVEELLLQR